MSVRCGVGRDDDEAATGRFAAGRRLGRELDAGGADVVAEHRAELVVVDPADERRGAAERRDARPCVLAADPPEISAAGPIAA